MLRDAGCRNFFVAHWAEVAAVAEHVPAAAVRCCGPLTGADAARFTKAVGVKPVINSLHQARLWRDAGGGLCDLMVDTGINRLGLPLAETGDEAIARLDPARRCCSRIFASADEDVPLNELQRSRWDEAAGILRHRRGRALPTARASCSARPITAS